jgi:hypothetical protein
MKKSLPVCWHPKSGPNGDCNLEVLKISELQALSFANAKKVFSLMQAQWTKERNKLNDE